MSTGEAQVAEAMPPNPGFSFGQIWRGDWRVVDRKGPGPALRDGGSLKSADGGASVRCGGSLVVGRTGSWPAEGRRSSVAEAMRRRCLNGGFGLDDGPRR